MKNDPSAERPAASIMQLHEDKLKERLIADLGHDERVIDAIKFSYKAHDGAVRDEGTPYIRHPLRVALILVEELGIKETPMVCAALLHDVLEDRDDIPYKELSHLFGEKTAQLVKCLTDEFKKKGLTRSERRERYLKRIAREEDPCLILKLCDRLDNLRSLPYSPNKEKHDYMRSETTTYLLPLLPHRTGAFTVLEKLLSEALRKIGSDEGNVKKVRSDREG